MCACVCVLFALMSSVDDEKKKKLSTVDIYQQRGVTTDSLKGNNSFFEPFTSYRLTKTDY